MPSKAFDKFERYMLKDVKSLIKAHDDLNHSGRGRRGLGHITCSAVVMLCAAWELYLEELIIESVEYLNLKNDLPSQLPLDVRKTLAKYVKNHDHNLKVLDIAGEGWKYCLLEHSKSEVEKLNSPKKSPVNQLFNKFLGIRKISDCWNYSDIDEFVKIRGSIAHKGSHADYVNIITLKTYLIEICNTALETDNYVAEYLKSNTASGSMSWKRRTKCKS